jgi:GxxExxY protein
VQRQIFLPLIYESLYIEKAYKIDLLVEDMFVIELKSLNPLPLVYFDQIRTQLSLINLKHGLLLNFKVSRMAEGIHRVFNNKGKEKI